MATSRRTSTLAGRAPRVLAGTSGFSYAAWRGTFYPPDLPARDMLAHYARALSTVEVNYTFHRLPPPALLTAWARQVPERFRFALKAPQRITHHLRLRDASEITTRFCTLATGLRTKLGPILFQLPPYLRADAARLRDFLASLPRGLEPAVEFRDPGWFSDETYDVLTEHRAALCIADAEGLTTPPVDTAPFGYLRLRRAHYTEADLDQWAARIRGMRRWKRTYVYFKHEDAARGTAYAKGLLARLA